MRIIFFMALMFGASFSFGQHFTCGFDMMPRQKTEKHTTNLKLAEQAKDMIHFPVQFHVIRKADQTTPYEGTINPDFKVDSIYLKSVIDNLNVMYRQAGIRFYSERTINYIDNDDYFSLVSDWQMYNIASNNNAQFRLNIYFTNLINIGGGGAYGGATPGYFVFMNSSFEDGQMTILAHEIGHYFDLEHTAGCTSCEPELVDGSNCGQLNVGDGFCDTPADPGELPVDETCVFRGSAKDLNGDNYEPDVFNFMSRTHRGCMHHFSKEQIAHMRSYIMDRLYVHIQAGVYYASFRTPQRVVTPGEPVQFYNQSGSGTSLTYEWFFEGGTPATSSEENPIVQYENPGQYDVKLIVSGIVGKDSLLLEDYINVTDQLITLPFELDFEDGKIDGLTIFNEGDLQYSIASPFEKFEPNVLLYKAPENTVSSQQFIYGDSSDIFIANKDFSASLVLPIDATSASSLALSFDVMVAYDFQVKHSAAQFYVNGECAHEIMFGDNQWHKMVLDLDSMAGKKFSFRVDMLSFSENSTFDIGKDDLMNAIAIDNIRIDEVLNVPDFLAKGTFGLCPFDTITFTDLSSGEIDTYLWDFGVDATPQTATGPGPHKVFFNKGGDQLVALTTTVGEHKVTEEKILQLPVIEIAEIIAPDTVCVGQEFAATISSQPLYRISYASGEGASVIQTLTNGIEIKWGSENGYVRFRESYFDNSRLCLVTRNKEIKVYEPQLTLEPTGPVFCTDNSLEVNMVGEQWGEGPLTTFYKNNAFHDVGRTSSIFYGLASGDTLVGEIRMLCGTIVTDSLFVDDQLLSHCLTAASSEFLDEGPRLYPNPTHDFLYSSIKEEEWKIMDVYGVEMLSGKGGEMNVTHLQAGTYWIKYENGMCLQFIKSE